MVPPLDRIERMINMFDLVLEVEFTCSHWLL